VPYVSLMYPASSNAFDTTFGDSHVSSEIRTLGPDGKISS
jgi:hypothetical protein